MTDKKNDDYQRGYREGFLDGFHAARDNESLMSPNVPTNNWGRFDCPKCKIRFSDMTGYVCPDNHCPTQMKVTC